jgi:hypothetical protein
MTVMDVSVCKAGMAIVFISLARSHILIGLSNGLEIRFCSMSGLALFLSGITLFSKTNLR